MAMTNVVTILPGRASDKNLASANRYL